MPVMDGWEFARELRAWRGTELPIPVSTASHKAEGWAAGIDAEALLVRPFDLDEFLGAVARLAVRERAG
jgi:DNA-binding response OmpR family regulator